jgi:hypothetical protein
MQHQTRSPDNIRIENRRSHNTEIWESDQWKEAKKQFIVLNQLCCECGDPTQVPHHPDIEVYGKPEYLNLSDTKPYCNICHNGKHKGHFKCPICGKLRSKSEGERCYWCLEKSDVEHIKNVRMGKNESRKKADKTRYEKAHPTKKEVVNGKWVSVRR